jgi:hypothetical protein
MWKQDNLEFEFSLGYIARPCLKKQKQANKKRLKKIFTSMIEKCIHFTRRPLKVSFRSRILMAHTCKSSYLGG